MLGSKENGCPSAVRGSGRLGDDGCIEDTSSIGLLLSPMGSMERFSERSAIGAIGDSVGDREPRVSAMRADARQISHPGRTRRVAS